MIVEEMNKWKPKVYGDLEVQTISFENYLILIGSRKRPSRECSSVGKEHHTDNINNERDKKARHILEFFGYPSFPKHGF